jgi:hypothetical protein
MYSAESGCCGAGSPRCLSCCLAKRTASRWSCSLARGCGRARSASTSRRAERSPRGNYLTSLVAGHQPEHWECEVGPGVSLWVGVEGVDLFGLVRNAGLCLFELVGFLSELLDVERVDVPGLEDSDPVGVAGLAV